MVIEGGLNLLNDKKKRKIQIEKHKKKEKKTFESLTGDTNRQVHSYSIFFLLNFWSLLISLLH